MTRVMRMRGVRAASVCLFAGVFAVACSSTSNRFPTSLNPAPTGQVAAEQLAPPAGAQNAQVAQGQQPPQSWEEQQRLAAAQQAGQVPGATPPGQTPQAQQPVAAQPVAQRPLRQEDVLGQWTVADNSSSCQLNVSLTGWQGGYRASTRNCSGGDLAQVGAWNLQGTNIVLKNQQGQQLAVLRRTAERRFDGSLNSGGPIVMMR